MRQSLLGTGADPQHARLKVTKDGGVSTGQTFDGLETLLVRPSSPFPKAHSLAKGWEVGFFPIEVGVPPKPPSNWHGLTSSSSTENEICRAISGPGSRQKPRTREDTPAPKTSFGCVRGGVCMPPVSILLHQPQ